MVKSSSDDMWFLEESDDISVELNHNFLSAKEADPPFAVEYEVDSDSDASFDDTGSESPVEVGCCFLTVICISTSLSCNVTSTLKWFCLVGCSLWLHGYFGWMPK